MSFKKMEAFDTNTKACLQDLSECEYWEQDNNYFVSSLPLVWTYFLFL